MSYKVGDKFLIEIEEDFAGDSGADVYRIKGFKTLMFDDYGLDKLIKILEIKEDETLDSIKQEAFEEGMQAAWEISRRIISSKPNGGINMKDLIHIFNNESIVSIFQDFSAAEAKDLIERFEAKQKIHEGDVVEILEQKAVVLAIDGDIASVYVIDNNDGKVQEVMLNQLKKVGISIDVRFSLANAYDVAKAFGTIKTGMARMSKAAEMTAAKVRRASERAEIKGSAE